MTIDDLEVTVFQTLFTDLPDSFGPTDQDGPEPASVATGGADINANDGTMMDTGGASPRRPED